MIEIHRTLSRDQNHARFETTGDLDALGAAYLRRDMSLVVDEGAHHLEVNLWGIRHVDVAGVEVLARGWERLIGCDGVSVLLQRATVRFWDLAVVTHRHALFATAA